MGFRMYYQAMPEDSELFRRLRDEPRLADVLGEMFTCGSYPLDLDGALANGDEADPAIRLAEYEGDSDEALRLRIDAWSADMHEDASDEDRAEFRDAFLALRSLILETEELHPGLIRRTVSFQRSEMIEERLAEHFTSLGLDGPADLATTMVYGGRGFDSSLGCGYIASEDVARFVEILRPISAEALLGPDVDEYLRGDYQAWYELYQEAADLGESILTYGS